jgi:CBS domain-containing protein
VLTVRQIVNGDQRPLQTISPDATVQGAVQIMASARIHALPVIVDDRLVGIVSEHDYVRKVASQGIPAWSVKIHEIMTRDVITVTPDDSIEHCMKLMATNRIRHLPVVEGGALTAVLSITDVVRALDSG